MKRAKGGEGGGEEERDLLARLAEALSDEEMRRVLVGALLTVEDAGAVERLAERLADDTAATLRGVLDSRGRERRGAKGAAAARGAAAGDAAARGRSGGKVVPGAAKVRQEWDRAWDEWEACVEETNDESGRYVYQPDSWDCPCPDPVTLEQDLGVIAERMRPLIARVVDEDLAPGFSFASAVGETEPGAGLPEWFDEADGWSLGSAATSALLEWEWRSASRAGEDAFAVVDRVCALGANCRCLKPDGATAAEFVLGLGAEDQRRVLEGIRANAASGHWHRVLESPHSAWFRLHLDLCRRASPAQYLEACGSSIEADWRLALPVIEDLLGRGSAEEALALVQRAAGLMSRSHLPPWNPREGLHARIWSSRSGGDPAVVELFRAWQRAAEALGDAETAAALDVQLAAERKCEDGDAFLAAIHETQAAFPATADRLFADWREQVVELGHGHAMSGREDPAQERDWVRALVDAARAGPDAGETFRAALRRWLVAVEQSPRGVAGHRGRLGELTRDLDHGGALAKRSKALRRVLTRDGEPGPRVGIAAWRRRWIERLGARELLDEVVEVWRRNAARLVPDPARASGSHYEDCAEWLAVARELDPAGFRALLERWQAIHRRRRNLWQALAERGLRVG